LQGLNVKISWQNKTVHALRSQWKNAAFWTTSWAGTLEAMRNQHCLWEWTALLRNRWWWIPLLSR